MPFVICYQKPCRGNDDSDSFVLNIVCTTLCSNGPEDEALVLVLHLIF